MKADFTTTDGGGGELHHALERGAGGGEEVPNNSAVQFGRPIIQQNRPIIPQNSFPVTWISVPGPKHTFLLVVVQVESRGNPKFLSIFD